YIEGTLNNLKPCEIMDTQFMRKVYDHLLKLIWTGLSKWFRFIPYADSVLKLIIKQLRTYIDARARIPNFIK
ncbi:hypothetical protein L9F63_006908, partial [Diploptera punctata]